MNRFVRWSALALPIATAVSLPVAAPAAAYTQGPLDYVYFLPGCSSGGVFSPAVKATFGLVGAPKNGDTHTPTKAVITVYSASGGIVNQSTVAAQHRTSISPTSGGFNYTAAVTYNDGVTLTGSSSIAAYTPVKNTGTIISDFFDPSDCYIENR